MVEFLRQLISFFSQYNIPYMLSGSMAMSLYTLPRMTRGFDFVAHLKKSDVKKLTEYFQSGYYCDEDSINEAIQNKGMFNIIDHDSGYKGIEKKSRDGLAIYKSMDRFDEIKYLWPVNIMNDTPLHIQDLQLALWLAKPPAERLLQFLIDNETLLKGLDEAKKAMEKKYAQEDARPDHGK